MEIDIKRCKELDMKYNYRCKEVGKVDKLGGFHATCFFKFKNNLSPKSIAFFMGARKHSVLNALYNVGLIDAPPPPPETPWTDEECDILMKLFNDGLNYNQIAKKMGRTVPSVTCKRKSIINGHLKTVATRKATVKKCICGDVILSHKNKCNWCWGKNEN